MRLTGRARPTKQVAVSVLNALQGFPNGATTKNIFNRLKPKPSKDTPIAKRTNFNTPHPLQSVNHLKNRILPVLQEKKLIEKVHIRPIANPAAAHTKGAQVVSNSSHGVWRWKACQDSSKSRPQ